MDLLKTLWKEQPWKFLLALILNLAHTVFNVTLLGTIGFYTAQMRHPPFAWWQFLALITGAVAAQGLAQTMSDKISQKMGADIRETLIRRFTAAQLQAIERAGPPPMVLLGFIDDTNRVAGAVPTIITLLRDLSFITGICGYLLWLSPVMMAVVGGMLLVGIVAYSPLRARGIQNAIKNRQTAEKMFASFRNVVEGVKQMKVNQGLEAAIIAQLRSCNADTVKYGRRMSMYFTAGVQLAVLLYFGTFMVFSYTTVDRAIDARVLAVYVISILLLLGPLLSLTSATQMISLAKISLGRIRRLSAALHPGAAGELRLIANHEAPSRADSTAIRSLELLELSHSYGSPQNPEFRLGPVSVRVNAGESLFIVGGNGTGKTTLVKLLVGLYSPESGQILIDGKPVEEDRRDWQRQLYSVVFGDNCLFESLEASDYDRQAGAKFQALAGQLKLTGRIDASGSLLAQAARCSSGERRRLAFCLASMEERPICVFDEFGADQDPECKELFYRTIVPELKALGKIVIVVTHDDRYFDQADQVLQLERGLRPTLKRRMVETGGAGAAVWDVVQASSEILAVQAVMQR